MPHPSIIHSGHLLSSLYLMRKKFTKSTLLVVSRFQRLDSLESIREHPQNRTQNLKNSIFRCFQVAGNTSCCMEWTGSHRIMHFGNNINRNTESSGSRSITCAFRFFNLLFQTTCTFYRTWASFYLMISTITHCFGSIFSVQIKQLYQFTSLFPWKFYLLRRKRDRLSRA